MTSRIKQEPQMGSTLKLAPSSPRPRKRRPITPPDSADSPTKKTQTPSKAALKRQESAQKKGWKEEWAQWVADSQWEKDHSYEQVPGTCEIHGSDGKSSSMAECFQVYTRKNERLFVVCVCGLVSTL